MIVIYSVLILLYIKCQGLTGYAGGSRVGKDGTVCYHNTLRKSEYGDMGHSEVVNLKLPIASVPSFAKEYFHLFRNGDRPDRV